MVDAKHIRQQFERMSRSELQESLSRPDDYTPEAFAILEQVAQELDIEKPATGLETDKRPAWRSKLKIDELADWYLRFDRAGMQDESSISNRDMSLSLGHLIGGMLIANTLFLIGLGASLVILPGGLIAYALFVAGILFVRRFILANKDPLELRRWRRCWQADFLGYNLTMPILAPVLMAGLTTYEDYVFWGLVVVAIALFCGMLTGLLWAQIMDRKDKHLVLEAFRAWKIDRAAGAESQVSNAGV